MGTTSTDEQKINKVEFPKKYKQFKDIFEEHVETTLSQHKSWDHEIRLQKGKESTYGSIYKLSEYELKVLKKYIEENLKKGFIRSSEFSAKYSILFASKKNGKLRLCVNYRQLNNITIKNRYTLPLISELQNRIEGAKIFTLLDLKEAYHHIRMKEGEE